MTEDVMVHVQREPKQLHLPKNDFKATLKHTGDERCCHYSNKDCGVDGTPSAEVRFEFRFNFQYEQTIFHSKVFSASCYAGGTLVFQGNRTEARIRCDHYDHGVSKFIYPHPIDYNTLS
ncbi:hypothetical protein BDB01DRAFT_846798 [Pilobolus umbonatus]|nr:hypothetical protein BDB01DRAFT_846798 [Pilobolus umbonatus]